MIELLYLLIATHITIICVTVFLHRGQAHRGIEFHPMLSHFMRAWLWLTTGMVTKQWVAIHRKHHRFSDVEGDPHSPHVFGIFKVFTQGALLYHEASKDSVMVDTYGRGTPADWVEHNIYQPHSRLGLGILLLLNCAWFGWIGALIWLVQMAWIPFWAAGVINGVGHWWGYRNGETKDHSRNISPWGIVIGGEELHNNHHLDPASARLSQKWYEFDIGWMYIKIFSWLGLLRLRAAQTE
jgi:stearoyl-CoA desaturase (delta-9 desaturase)